MSFMFSHPSSPSPPPMPTPPEPEKIEAQSKAKTKEEEKKRLRRGGRGSTILTSPLGLLDRAPTERHTLLGV